MSNREVLAIEPGTLPSGRFKGSKSKKVLCVLYSDGVVMHRCADCDFEAEAFATVSFHRKEHITDAEREARKAEAEVKVGSRNMQRVVEIVDDVANTATRKLARKVARLESRLADERKARRKAERDLDALRKAINGITVQ